MLAAAALALTACSLLQEDDSQKSIRINLPPIISASGNSRSISDDRIPTLKTETKRYRVTVNGMTREGTGSSYEFTLPVGINSTVTVECLNSSGEVIIRAVKDFTVAGGDNIIDINLKADGNEIIPASAAGRVTYSYGEATVGNTSGLPSDQTTYKEGDLFTVDNSANMTWDHGTFTVWKTNVALVGDTDSSTAGVQANGDVQAGGKYKMPKGGVTLTAQWQKKTYTISYDMNAAGSGGTQTSTNISDDTGNVALGPAQVSATKPDAVSIVASGKNFTFTHWLGSDGNTYQPGQNIPSITGNLTLTAQWSDKDVWTVTYIKGSTQATEQNITNWKGSDNVVDGESVTLPTLSATGYTFNGWQITGEAVNKTGSYTPTGNVDATAQWTPNSYQVTYVLDGGSGGPASGNVQYNASVALDAPTKTGYNFAGWSDGSTTYGGTSGNNSLTMPAQAVTLTAQWTVNSYQVTYVLDGGSGGPASGNVQYNTSVSLDAPTKAGYAFAGWSDGSTTYGGTSGNNSLTMPAQAVTLTAQWTPIQYTITYDANGGGTNPGNTTFTVEDAYVTFASSGTLAKTGYTCMGWETTGRIDIANMTRPADLIQLITSGTTLALRAKWEISYKYDKGSWEVGDIVCDNGNALTLANYNAVKTDTELSPAVAVVYKNDSAASKVYIVGKVHEQTGLLEWCLGSANGNNANFASLQCEPDDGTTDGAYTFNGTPPSGAGQNTDGSGNWQKLRQELAGDDDTGTTGNYPAWEWVNDYGTAQSLTGDLATGWYLPTVAELFDIWKANNGSSAIDNALTAVGGSTFSGSTKRFYLSSSQNAYGDSHALDLNFDSGSYGDDSKGASGRSLCAVHQLPYY